MKKIGFKKLAVSVLLLFLVLAAIYSGLHHLESTVLHPQEQAQETTPKKTVDVEGTAYFPRQDITTLLVMGIDQYGPAVSSGYNQNKGRADMLLLLILDQTNERYDILCLNRDTMATMPYIGVLGDRAGTYYGQLGLAHTFGDGMEQSCEVVRDAVSDLLGGVTIDYYVSMRMDAVAMINDAVGGVTVDITEDFSKVDPTMPTGLTTLLGQQALTYVQNRRDVDDQLNLSRMERQKKYMSGFMTAFQNKRQENSNFLLKVYDQVSDYLVSDCSIQVINGLLSRCADYSQGQILSPQGENVLGEDHYEFYVDEEALQELVLSLFYSQK